jgi:NAD(P)-dependent dehydrogenase (short-subunit alcohol dehydrogenase family)
MSDALRRELSRFGINVTVVQPGAIPTEMVGPQHRVARAARNPSSPYRATTEFFERMMDMLYTRGNGQTAETVANVIVDIARSRRPPARRRIGPDARLITALNSVLPTRMVDWLSMRAFERANASAANHQPKNR